MADKTLKFNLGNLKTSDSKKLLNGILKKHSREIVRDYNRKSSTVTMLVTSNTYGRNVDRSKKIAEQRAAGKKKFGQEPMRVRAEQLAINDMVRMIKMKYSLVAIVFYKIVSRTPVDENYVYEKEVNNNIDYKASVLKRKEGGLYYRVYDKESKKYVIRKRSLREIYEHTNHVRFVRHKKDTNVARDHWWISVKANGRNITYNTKYFENLGVDFNKGYENGGDIEGNNDWRKIQHALLPVKGEEILNCNINSYKIWNDSDHWDVLEFGKYEGNSDAFKKGTAAVGDELGRYHGVHNKYSVQAPKGMVSRTVAEIKVIENQAAKGEIRTDSKNTVKVPDGFRAKHLNGNHLPKDAYFDGSTYQDGVRTRVRKELTEEEFVNTVLGNKKAAKLFLTDKYNEHPIISEAEAERDIERIKHRMSQRLSKKRVEARKKVEKAGSVEKAGLTDEELELYQQIKQPVVGDIAGQEVITKFNFSAEQKEWIERSKEEEIELQTFFGKETEDTEYITVYLFDGILMDERGREIKGNKLKEALDHAEEM